MKKTAAKAKRERVTLELKAADKTLMTNLQEAFLQKTGARMTNAAVLEAVWRRHGHTFLMDLRGGSAK